MTISSDLISVIQDYFDNFINPLRIRYTRLKYVEYSKFLEEKLIYHKC